MPEILRFVVPGKPQRWERPGNRAGGGRRTKDAMRAALGAVRAQAWRALRSAGLTAIPDGPLELDIDAVHARPKSRPARVPLEVWKRGTRCRRPSTPDRDNVAKLINDGMQPARNDRKVVIAPGPLDDDDRVDLGHVRGWYGAKGEQPHTLVVLRSVPWEAP